MFLDIIFVAVDIEVEAAIGDSSASAERRLDLGEESTVQEPIVGMEFESEDAAKEFYDNYARRAGFVMRIDQCRRSEVDKRILSRRLSCNKQGYYVKMKDQFGPARKPRTSTREGCKAMMLVKVDKSGKWVVTRFVKEHTHPLIVSGRPSRNAMVSFVFVFLLNHSLPYTSLPKNMIAFEFTCFIVFVFGIHSNGLVKHLSKFKYYEDYSQKNQALALLFQCFFDHYY